jgi:hypothetical protein
MDLRIECAHCGGVRHLPRHTRELAIVAINDDVLGCSDMHHEDGHQNCVKLYQGGILVLDNRCVYARAI